MEFNTIQKLQRCGLLPRPIKEMVTRKWLEQGTQYGEIIGFFVEGDPMFFFTSHGRGNYLYDNWSEQRTIFEAHVDSMSQLDWTKITWMSYDNSSFCYEGPHTGMDISKISPEDFGWCPRCLAEKDMCDCDQEDPHLY